MSATTDTPELLALRDAAILYASVPPDDEETPADVAKERAKTRQEALAAAGKVMAQPLTEALSAELRRPQWFADLTEEQTAALAHVMQHHGPLNVVINGYPRRWVNAACAAVPGLE